MRQQQPARRRAPALATKKTTAPAPAGVSGTTVALGIAAATAVASAVVVEAGRTPDPGSPLYSVLAAGCTLLFGVLLRRYRRRAPQVRAAAHLTAIAVAAALAGRGFLEADRGPRWVAHTTHIPGWLDPVLWTGVGFTAAVLLFFNSFTTGTPAARTGSARPAGVERVISR
jgi:hypothetical protein